MPNAITLQSRYGTPIGSLDQWRDLRKAVNSGWVPGKSAWETANAWVGEGHASMPPDFRALLESHAATAGFTDWQGQVERKTHLHHRPPAGPRNHDLVLWDAGKSIFVGVESKADDGFAGTMRQQLDSAARRKSKGSNTRLDLRVAWLRDCLLGSNTSIEVEDLPFQLFAGVAGTLLEAQASGARIAVFVVHQFRTHLTNDDDIECDCALLDAFVSHLIRHNPETSVDEKDAGPLRWGQLAGPIRIQSRCCGDSKWDMPAMPLFIGKVITDRTALS